MSGKKEIYFGTSTIGPGHIRSSIPNQDSFIIKKYKNCSVIVVSDGVGSKPLSHIGSKTVCKVVSEVLKDYVNSKREIPIKDVLRLIHAKWLFELAPYPPQDCYATVLFALVTENKLILGRLGDGMICCKKADEKILMIDNKDGSFSNISKCIRDKFSFNDWEIQSLDKEGLDFLVLTTDGISDDIQVDRLFDF